MNKKNRVLFTLALVVMALMAMSVGQVLADSGHAPVCEKGIVKGVHILECFDADGDIINVDVKSNVKYDLHWNESRVVLRVYPFAQSTSDGEVVRLAWSVRDKVGHAVDGTLP